MRAAFELDDSPAPMSRRPSASMFPMRASLEPGAPIPAFPKAKEVSLDDRFTVESITRRFAPYSDYDFTSLWSWDTKRAIRLSRLNGNLVVRFTDYVTGKPFYSFLGDNAVEETAWTLARKARLEGITTELRLLPEPVAERLAAAGVQVEEDPDGADYVLSVEKMASYQGNKLGPKRNFVNRFNRAFVSETRALELSDTNEQRAVLDVFQKWTDERPVARAGAHNELVALRRLLFAADTIPELVAHGTFIGGEMAGFCITEIVGNEHSVLHFEKALSASYVGIYPHMMQQMARALAARGVRYINYEQDLGIAGLRQKKQSLSPAKLLKKFTARVELATSLYPLPETRLSILPASVPGGVWIA